MPRSGLCLRLVPLLAVFLPVLLAALLSPASLAARQDTLTQLFAAPCQRLGINPLLARAIARVESSLNPWCVTIDGRDHFGRTYQEAVLLAQRALAKGRSVDLGLMQINGWWLRRLKLTPAQVLEPANNVWLGLTLLKLEMRRFGPTWKAVGAYHSKTPWRQQRYARTVARHYQALAARHTPGQTAPKAAAKKPDMSEPLP